MNPWRIQGENRTKTAMKSARAGKTGEGLLVVAGGVGIARAGTAFRRQVKCDPSLHKLYFFRISAIEMGLPGFSRTAMTSERASASSIASCNARAISFISFNERLGTSLTISATLI